MTKEKTREKSEIRSIIVDILLGKESTKYGPSQKSNLRYGVAEVLSRREGKDNQYGFNAYPADQDLTEEENELFEEVFWDLILDRKIVPGLNRANPDLPWFRLRSDADLS